MSAIFQDMQVYGGKWEQTNSQPLDEDDLKMFSGAKVVSSQYGMSVCFFLANGKGQAFMPISHNSREVAIGEAVDLTKVEIETLHRDGDEDIYRVRI